MKYKISIRNPRHKLSYKLARKFSYLFQLKFRHGMVDSIIRAVIKHSYTGCSCGLYHPTFTVH
jgi:hypothetical protein